MTTIVVFCKQYQLENGSGAKRYITGLRLFSAMRFVYLCGELSRRQMSNEFCQNVLNMNIHATGPLTAV